MRAIDHAVNRQLTEQSGGSSSASTAVKRYPRDPLTLPRRFVAPGSFVEHASSGAPLADLALALYDEGFINEDDASKDLSELIKVGLVRVTEGALGKVQFVGPIDVVVSNTLAGCEGYLNETESIPNTYWIALELDNEVEPCIAGKRLLELENAVPGLGRTALFAAERAGTLTAGCWSPTFVRDEATRFYWHGASSQKEWLEELECSNEDPDDHELSPDQYDAAFTVDWALDAGRALDGFGLVQALECSDASVGDVAEKVCEVLRMTDQRAMFPGVEFTDQEPAYRGCLIRWDEYDPVMRVIDDFIQNANQCCDGYTTLSSIWEVKTTKEDFAQWLNSYRQALKLYKVLDQLLALLHSSEPGEKNESGNQH